MLQILMKMYAYLVIFQRFHIQLLAISISFITTLAKNLSHIFQTIQKKLRICTLHYIESDADNVSQRGGIVQHRGEK